MYLLWTVKEWCVSWSGWWTCLCHFSCITVEVTHKYCRCWRWIHSITSLHFIITSLSSILSVCLCYISVIFWPMRCRLAGLCFTLYVLETQDIPSCTMRGSFLAADVMVFGHTCMRNNIFQRLIHATIITFQTLTFNNSFNCIFLKLSFWTQKYFWCFQRLVFIYYPKHLEHGPYADLSMWFVGLLSKIKFLSPSFKTF